MSDPQDRTAADFSPGEESPGTSYGDVSGIGTDAVREDAVPGGEVGGGLPPQDHPERFDESQAADDAVTEDIYAPGRSME